MRARRALQRPRHFTASACSNRFSTDRYREVALCQTKGSWPYNAEITAMHAVPSGLADPDDNKAPPHSGFTWPGRAPMLRPARPRDLTVRSARRAISGCGETESSLMKSRSRHPKQAREPHLQGPSTSLVHALDRSTSPQSRCPIGSRSPCPPPLKRQQHSPARYPASAPCSLENFQRNVAIRLLVRAHKIFRLGHGNPEIFRGKNLFRNCAASDLEHPRLRQSS